MLMLINGVCVFHCSLRAQYSVPDTQVNVVHGSDSVDNAEKELGFFFPKQSTLAVIKPDAAGEHKGEIVLLLTKCPFSPFFGLICLF